MTLKKITISAIALREIFVLLNLLGIELTELLQVFQRDIIASNVEHNVLESTAVAVGEDETITVDELGVLGVESHELTKQSVSHRSTTHRST
jgi:hypothetical protein